MKVSSGWITSTGLALCTSPTGINLVDASLTTLSTVMAHLLLPMGQYMQGYGRIMWLNDGSYNILCIEKINGLGHRKMLLLSLSKTLPHVLSCIRWRLCSWWNALLSRELLLAFSFCKVAFSRCYEGSLACPALAWSELQAHRCLLLLCGFLLWLMIWNQLSKPLNINLILGIHLMERSRSSPSLNAAWR